MAYRRLSEIEGGQSTEKQPSANADRRVEKRKRQQKMRKNSRDGQRYEHQWNEHHSVQYAGGDDLAREAAEKIEPADDRHGHTHCANDRSLVSDESRIPEDCLHHSRPNNYQNSNSQIDHAVHYRVF